MDELEEMHMKVLSEMTDETTKSVGTVEVRGVWNFDMVQVRSDTCTPENERMSPKKGTISMRNTSSNFQPFIFTGH